MRLNGAVRSEITRNATKILRNREIALQNREEVLALRCYNVAVPLKIRNLLAALQGDAVDKNRMSYLSTRKDIRYNIAGQGLVLIASEYLPVPTQYYVYHHSLGIAITLGDNEKLVNDVRAWQADREQFLKDKKAAETTLSTVLKSVGSTESLFKVWPEGKKFYSVPPLTPLVKTGVPAVQMQALNTMLGLTPA